VDEHLYYGNGLADHNVYKHDMVMGLGTQGCHENSYINRYTACVHPGASERQ
jgi:hypothetical protein